MGFKEHLRHACSLQFPQIRGQSRRGRPAPMLLYTYFMLRVLLLALVWLTSFWSVARANTPWVSHIESDRAAALLAARFPPEASALNCHGTALFVTGVLSVPISIPNDELFFSTGCFSQVTSPRTGDMGVFVMGKNPGYSLHSFVYLDDGHLFHKANPGWNENPFVIVSAPAGPRAYFSEFKQWELRWGSYVPSPSCFLTRFQSWLDTNRAQSPYGTMIIAVEQHGLNRQVRLDAVDFNLMLDEMERLLPEDFSLALDPTSERAMLLHLIHEYLILPQFAVPRKELVARQTATMTSLFAGLQKEIANGRASRKLKDVFSDAQVKFDFTALGIYLHITDGFLEPYEIADGETLSPHDFETFNTSQDTYKLAVRRDLGLTILEVTTADARWRWVVSRHN